MPTANKQRSDVAGSLSLCLVLHTEPPSTLRPCAAVNRKHQPRKRFGQNFLRDEAIIDRIAGAINASPKDHLVEIGPGMGALTRVLLEAGCPLDAIELDRDLTVPLLAAFSIHNNFTLHNADALSFDFSSLLTDGKRLRIVGNLPYNISTPLIFRLLESADAIEDMHFMLQREVVQRLTAEPGGKHWGRLAIMTQYRCTADALFEVPPEAFDPAPKVQSAIVRLEPHRESPWERCDDAQLERVVKAAFSQRRKTLRNNLKGLIPDTLVEQLGIDPGVRAETLELANFVSLAQLLPPGN